MTAFDIVRNVLDKRNMEGYQRMYPGLNEAHLDAVALGNVENELNKIRRRVFTHVDEREALKYLATLDPEFFQQGMKIEDLDDGVFRALICTDWQKIMLREFGDVRNGMNQLTLIVIDEFGRGIPVGFALVTNEDAASWKSLLEYFFERAGRKAGDTATMSDCDPTIIAAARDIGVQRHLLCAFQMLQAIGGRFKSNLLSTSAHSMDLGSTFTSPLRARSSASDSVSSNPVKWLRRSSPRRDTVSPICTQLY